VTTIVEPQDLSGRLIHEIEVAVAGGLHIPALFRQSVSRGLGGSGANSFLARFGSPNFNSRKLLKIASMVCVSGDLRGWRSLNRFELAIRYV
jgi:hypothetical protein